MTTLDVLINQGLATHRPHYDPVNQALALEQIPASISSQPVSNAKARALLKWFKSSFFTWTNAPACSQCSAAGTTALASVSPPTLTHELAGQASRVEVYACSACSATTRFPRYNHLPTLLSTRTGRCGEWANTFTLCAMACGFESRYILDATDHVWTEIYSPEWQRWVHCDACEEAFDTPLVYEAGWGKALSYVLAFGPRPGLVTDVTRRYSRKFDAEMILRRYRMTTPSGVAFLEAHRGPTFEAEVQEFVQSIFAIVPLKPEERHGRMSGSLEWRVARGETGSEARVLLEGPSIVIHGVDRSPRRRGVNCVALRPGGDFAVSSFDTMHDFKAIEGLVALVRSAETVLVATSGDFKWPGSSELGLKVGEGESFVAVFERGVCILFSNERLMLPFESQLARFKAGMAALTRRGVPANQAVCEMLLELNLGVQQGEGEEE